MGSNNKGGKMVPSRWTWAVIGFAVILVLGVLSAEFSILGRFHFYGLLLSFLGSGLLCLAALLDCAQKGERKDKDTADLKKLVATGASLAFAGIWALYFVYLENNFGSWFPW